MKKFIFIALIALFAVPSSVFALPAEVHSLFNRNIRYYNRGCEDSSQTSNAQLGSAYLIGDSIAEGTQIELDSALETKGAVNVTINAKSSRRLSEGGSDLDGMSVLANDKSQYASANTIIIELGTNGGISPDNIFKTIDTIKQTNSTAKIYWVNIGVDNSKRSDPPIDGDETNNVLQQNASAGYTVIDWAAVVKEHPEYIDSNPTTGLGVHPSGSGKQGFADAVANGVSGVSNGSVSGSGDCACPIDSTMLVGAENAEKIYNFLIGKGLTPPQAAGFMGNLQAEGGFDPTIVQGGEHSDTIKVDGHTGYGIAQWTSINRQQGLADAALAAAKPASDLAVQLDYLWFEITEGPLRGLADELKATPTIEEATHLILYKFENPADKVGQEPIRLGFANDILTQFGSGAGSGAISGGAASDCASGIVAGNITQTALNFAWLEPGHGTTPKPEYAAAIQQFNPNAPYGGADCGSFVGTVMIASGADPSFPKFGTKAQEDYVRSHPERYDLADKVSSVSELQPGDILIVNRGDGQGPNGHIYIFVGTQPNSYNEASASGGTRMPNLDHAVLSDSRGDYMRARLK